MLQTIIVDSDAAHRATLRRLLSGMPSVVIVGEHAPTAEALAELSLRRPDVLLLEIQDDPSIAAGVERLAKTLPNTAILAMGLSVSADLVIQVIRAGALEFLRRPVDRADLAAALEKVVRFRQSTPTKRPTGHITSVFSARGGLGVTTMATNLAVCLAERRSGEVLLMDLDTSGQSDLAAALDLKPAYSVVDAFENLNRLDTSFLRGLVAKHGSGVSVLPGPYGRARVPLPATAVRAGLEVIRSCFDHVLLDLRHDPDPPTLAAFDLSDSVLVLTALNVAALRSTVAGLETLRQGGVLANRVKVIVMRADAGDEVTIRQAEDTLGVPVFWKTPNDYSTVVSSINRGQPVVTASPRSRIAKNLRELAAALAGKSGSGSATEPAPTLATSLLRLVWNPKGGM